MLIFVNGVCVGVGGGGWGDGGCLFLFAPEITDLKKEKKILFFLIQWLRRVARCLIRQNVYLLEGAC